MLRILYSSHFARAMKKLDPGLKVIVAEREKIFREDMFDSRLRTHRLRGELAGYYSFSITYKYRILFEIEANDDVIFIDVGDHSIYD
jgi:mRNA-degrading endonuclease YafQ of YafQ-DinJ toxin-antitoxin module